MKPLHKQADHDYAIMGSFLIFCVLFSVTFLDKIAIPLGGAQQVFIGVPIMLLAAAGGFAFHYLEIHNKRLCFYLLMVAVLTTTQFFNPNAWSLPSFVMLILTHLPYVFNFRHGVLERGTELRIFRKIAIFLAVLGVVQFYAQYLIGTDYAFFMDTMVPPKFIMANYHGLNELSEGAMNYKTNGVFLSEPSSFSQILALAAVVEILFFRKYYILAVYAIALALTFSGTGLMILMVLLPAYLIHKKNYFLLMCFVILGLTAPLWAPMVGLGGTLERATEFTSNQSSGYARFISPAVNIDTYMLSEGPRAFFFGMGAGSMNDIPSDTLDYEAALSTWGKIFYEYGFMGTLAYVVFFAYAIYSARKNGFLTAALLLQFLFMGEYLFPPTVHALIIALLIWPRERTEEKKVLS